MFLSLDGTFWIQVINFGIFFLLLQTVFLRPVGEAVRRRRAYIEEVASDSERFVHQVRALRVESERWRAEARRDGEAEIAAARTAAEDEAELIVAAAIERARAAAGEA
ncbi:MAG: hypothetical protein ACREM8_12030, partial [Vulcanimicrobiaceae bacterium]